MRKARPSLSLSGPHYPGCKRCQPPARPSGSTRADLGFLLPACSARPSRVPGLQRPSRGPKSTPTGPSRGLRLAVFSLRGLRVFREWSEKRPTGVPAPWSSALAVWTLRPKWAGAAVPRERGRPTGACMTQHHLAQAPTQAQRGPDLGGARVHSPARGPHSPLSSPSVSLLPA